MRGSLVEDFTGVNIRPPGRSGRRTYRRLRDFAEAAQAEAEASSDPAVEATYQALSTRLEVLASRTRATVQWPR